MSTGFWISYGLLWILVVFGSLLIVGLFREIGRAYLSESDSLYRDGHAPGTDLSDVTVRLDGRTESLSGLVDERRLTFVLSVLPSCEVCVPALEETIADPFVKSSATVVVLVADEHPHEYESFRDRATVAHLPQREVGRLLRIRAYPFAFVLDHEGIVRAKGPMFGSRAASGLLRDAQAFVAPPRGRFDNGKASTHNTLERR